MKLKFRVITILTYCFLACEVTAQDYLNSGTIEEQYKSLVKDAETYQQYKVITRKYLNKYQKNVIDSINASKDKLINIQKQVDAQQAEIEQLKTQLADTQNILEQTNLEKESISFLGINLNKLQYKMLMWTLLGLAIAALIFYILRFNTSNSTTKEIRKSLSEIQAAFDAYKKRALEKEQKISRMLQDEMNKNK